MIQKILKNIRKYHEANFWIAERMILEEKKQAIAAPAVSNQTITDYEPAVQQYSQAVFTKYDVGHNEEERSKIQKLYAELENLFDSGRLAI